MFGKLDEIEFRNTPFLYEALLSDGTVIHVMDGGKAIDLNGNSYTATYEYEDDGDLQQVSYWTKD